jgi:hypothetical protein
MQAVALNSKCTKEEKNAEYEKTRPIGPPFPTLRMA